MKTFKLEIPDFYENGMIGVTLVTGMSGVAATTQFADLDRNQELFVNDNLALEIRSPKLETPEDNPEPHWTPVTDDLPENDGEYLVTVENDIGKRRISVSRYWRDDLMKRPNGHETHWAVETGMYAVLAWMELPPRWEA